MQFIIYQPSEVLYDETTKKWNEATDLFILPKERKMIDDRALLWWFSAHGYHNVKIVAVNFLRHVTMYGNVVTRIRFESPEQKTMFILEST